METTTEIQKKPETLTELLDSPAMKKRFEEVLGKRTASFCSSIISATKGNPALAKCSPISVISSGMIAATLDLPINQNLGFAAIVPYGTQAQFQMMWRGFVQLAIRTGQYANINVTEIYEGELIEHNRITGQIHLDQNKKKSNTVIGYCAYFKLVSGFEKYMYWTVEEVTAHGKKYSKSFNSPTGRWKLDFDAMAKKTVLKMLLSRYGILSVEMQEAQIKDQAIINDAGEVVEYPDGAGEIDLLLRGKLIEEMQMAAEYGEVEKIRQIWQDNPAFHADSDFQTENASCLTYAEERAAKLKEENK